MPIAHKGSTVEEQISTIMLSHNIPPESLGSKAEITSVVEAVQWLHQKAKTTEKWKTGTKYGGRAAAAVGVGAGVVAGLLSAGVGTVAAVAVGSAALGSDPGSSLVAKMGRGAKSAFKKLQGTQGVHRRQAANILYDYFIEYMNGGPRDRRARLAYDVLSVFFNPKDLDALYRHLSPEKAKEEIAEQFRS